MKKECPVCLGSGELSYFKGISRFVLSQMDCPECAGMGFIIESDASESSQVPPPSRSIDPHRDVPSGWDPSPCDEGPSLTAE
jgi:DnaJ-class molecular chaperone